MSNLSELITDVNEADHTSLNIFGAAVGAIADFAGGIGAIGSAIGLINSIVSPDRTAELLEDIRNELRNGFKRLGLELKADELLREWDNLDEITRDAEGIYLTLAATVSSNVGQDEVVRQIGICATAINGLSFTVHPEQWLVTHDDQVYFAHLGDRVYNAGGASSSVYSFAPGPADTVHTPSLQGMFSCQGMTFSDVYDPGGDANGHVFSFVYTLPAYMKLVTIFLATAAALDPNFASPDKYAKVIRLASKDLQAVLQKIQSAIVNIALPDADSMLIPFPFDRLSPFVGQGYDQQRASGRYDNTYWFLGWGAGSLITDTFMPCGAVNLYSGFFAIRGYPTLDIPSGVFPHAGSTATSPPDAGSDFFIRPVSKLLLRSLARTKDVYAGMGLRNVWATINRLNGLVGDAPMPQPFGSLSLREIFGVLGFPRNPFFKAPLSIGKLALYLAGSSPFFPIPTRPFSLRQLVDAFPPSGPFDG